LKINDSFLKDILKIEVGMKICEKKVKNQIGFSGFPQDLKLVVL
jgi:hypothetical protein